MYYTTDAMLYADLDNRDRAQAAAEAEEAYWDEFYPDWREAERAGDTLLSERDFPVYDDSDDWRYVSDDDWQFFLAETYCDPAERGE